MRKGRLAVLWIGVTVALLAGIDPAWYSLAALHQSLDDWQAAVARAPLSSALVYALVYVGVTGLSLPGAVPLTLLAGALFGPLWGTVIVSFSSTAGASIAFLMSRHVLRGGLQRRFSAQLVRLDAGIAREGAFHLFALRMVPVVPFMLVNLLMGLSALRLSTFWWVSQLGMLPATFVYVQAGTALAHVESVQGLLSMEWMLALTLLALLPLVTRRLLAHLRLRRSGFRRPRRFDRNLIVIGAGAAGLVSAYVAAASRARVTLIERHRMGGDCLNTGCVPSKALLASARAAHAIARGPALGIRTSGEVDFAAVMARVRARIDAIAPNDSIERYTGLGVECLQGSARLVTPWEVDIDGRRLSARHVIIATGARPRIPDIPGLERVPYLTTETVWSLREAPARLIVLGGGAAGCELAQAMARLGVAVTLIERGSRLLARESAAAAQAVADALMRDGVDLRLAHTVSGVTPCEAGVLLRCEAAGHSLTVEGDTLLVVTGRVPNTAGLGLEALGIETDADGRIITDASQQCPNHPGIFACGDVASPVQLTSVAGHQATHAALNALLAPWARWKTNIDALPRCTYTDPEVASVGWSAQEAELRGFNVEVLQQALAGLDRAIVDDEPVGHVTVVVTRGSGRVLGVTVVAPHASELITPWTLAIRHRWRLGQLLSMPTPYPSWSEHVPRMAGEWRRAHAPSRVLRWLEIYHRWRRAGITDRSPP